VAAAAKAPGGAVGLTGSSGEADETIKAKLDAIAVYTVGFGDDVRDDVMRRVASQPEMYRRSTGNRDLERIYAEIAGDVVCR
jgi:hypothetical protein